MYTWPQQKVRFLDAVFIATPIYLEARGIGERQQHYHQDPARLQAHAE